MNVFTELKTILLADSSVTSKIGGAGTYARIWNSWPATAVVPCVIIEVDSETENNDLSGEGSLVSASVMVTCRSNDDTTTHALHRAVRSALAGYSGTVGVIIDETARSVTPKSEGSADHWFDRSIDCTVLFTEAP